MGLGARPPAALAPPAWVAEAASEPRRHPPLSHPLAREQECAHAIDAAVLAGQDVRRLPYAERRRRLALLLQALRADPAQEAQEGGRRPGERRLPVRLKPSWPARW